MDNRHKNHNKKFWAEIDRLVGEKDYVFKDMGQCGVYYQESYASPAVADYDNDGDLDLFFTTVYGTASFIVFPMRVGMNVA